MPLLLRSNDEVERRGDALPTNEADLSRSSIPSLAHRKRDPRLLEPIVRLPHHNAERSAAIEATLPKAQHPLPEKWLLPAKPRPPHSPHQPQQSRLRRYTSALQRQPI